MVLLESYDNIMKFMTGRGFGSGECQLVPPGIAKA
jgi:hypothetical protein